MKHNQYFAPQDPNEIFETEQAYENRARSTRIGHTFVGLMFVFLGFCWGYFVAPADKVIAGYGFVALVVVGIVVMVGGRIASKSDQHISEMYKRQRHRMFGDDEEDVDYQEFLKYKNRQRRH